MPSDSAKLDFAKLYLRRVKTLQQIKDLAEVVATALFSGQTKVTITGTSLEGGNASGTIEFEAAFLGLACEQLIRDMDPTAPAPTRQALGDIVRYQ